MVVCVELEALMSVAIEPETVSKLVWTADADAAAPIP